MTVEVEFVEAARYRVLFEAATAPTETTWFRAIDHAAPDWPTSALEAVEDRELTAIRVVRREAKDVQSV